MPTTTHPRKVTTDNPDSVTTVLPVIAVIVALLLIGFASLLYFKRGNYPQDGGSASAQSSQTSAMNTPPAATANAMANGQTSAQPVDNTPAAGATTSPADDKNLSTATVPATGQQVTQ